MADENGLYATAANFGSNEDESTVKKPWVKEVTVPESIKRKYPSKHYVYKVVVKWTNGKETVIYRRYSLFFDFVVKLQELVTKLRKIDPKLEETDLELPELPSKGLFTRSQTHQVAEKRRRKVEEFCQQLILLPPEISESGLVLGFFNIWPDDTLLRNNSPAPQHVISAPILVSNNSDTPAPLLKESKSNSSLNGVAPPIATPITTSTATPTSALILEKGPAHAPLACRISNDTKQSMDSIISHPDEMEHLEQYRVLGNYERKDSHQVDLYTGQVVHVIEKHDTGWWMVMSEDEQGYAPAAYLEPLEGGSQETDIHPQTNTDEVYEAMETYVPDSEDEVGFQAQDRIEVIAKSMDGWWKIRCNGQTGFAPAALIRRVQTGTGFGFEQSERSIYEDLNIHHPPPRRNTLDRSVVNHIAPGYLSPRSHPPLAKVMAENIYCDPAEESPDEEEHIYKVPRLSTDQPSSVADSVRQRSPSKDSQEVYRTESTGSSGGQISARKGSKEQNRRGSEGLTSGQNSARRGSSNSHRSSKSISPPPIIETSGGHENSGTPSTKKSPLRPPVAPKPPTKPKPKVEKMEPEQDTYEPMNGTNAKISSRSNSTSESAVPNHSVDDYEDLDKVNEPPADLIPAMDDYVDMSGANAVEELLKEEGGKSSVPPPPPRVANKPSPLKNKPPSISKTFSIDPELPVFEEDQYIEMDSSTPIDKVPSPEARLPSVSSPLPRLGSSPGKPKITKPSPPLPYTHKPGEIKTKPALIRAKSLEDLLSAPRDYEETGSPYHSPPLPKRNFFAPPLPARNPPTEKPAVVERDVSFLPLKPKPGKTRNPFKRKDKQMPNGHSELHTEFKFPDPHEPPAVPKPRPTGRVAPERSISPIARHSISPPGMRERSPHPPLMHTNSEPNFEDRLDNMKKTKFVAVHSFVAPSDRCLGFSAGDKGELVKRNEESGWWLVRVGEKMGWTPGEYWKEISGRDRSVTNAPLPTVPPPVIRKPHSHTVAEITPLPELTSSLESSMQDSFQSGKASLSLSNSLDGEVSPLTESGKHVSPGAKGKAPLKPKSIPEAGSPLNARKSKPPAPQKYSSIGSIPATKGGGTPTPPPLPPANATRRLGSHSSSQDVTSPKGTPTKHEDGYIMLHDVSTEPIENASWFAGKMERIQADSFLMEHGRQREFLVRERTTKDGYYALSVRYHYNIRHFNIDPTPDGKYSMGTLVFPNIDEIIKHYQSNSLFIHDNQHVTLGQAVAKKKTSRGGVDSKTNGV